MKTSLGLCIVVLSVTSAFAQSSGAVTGAVVGGVAGAVIGNNSGSLGHNGLRGAAYGAGAGLLIGAAADSSHDRGQSRVYVSSHRPAYVYRSGPSYYGHSHAYRGYPGYGYGYAYSSRPYVSYGYSDYGYDYSDYSSGRSNYVGSGLFWGALGGAILGNNSGAFGHNGLRGAAYGAGAGLLIGAVAESSARRQEALAQRAEEVASARASVDNNVSAAAPSPAPAPKSVINKPASTSSMAAANSLFGR